MSDEQTRRDGPPIFAPGKPTSASSNVDKQVPIGQRSLGDLESDSPPQPLTKMADPASAPTGSGPSSPSVAANQRPRSEWALPNPRDRVNEVRSPAQQRPLETNPYPLDAAQSQPSPQPVTEAYPTYNDAAPGPGSSWDRPASQTNQSVRYDTHGYGNGIRLQKTAPRGVGLVFAIAQLVTVGCLSLVVFRFIQAFSDLGVDSGGEMLILILLSGFAIVAALAVAKPRAHRVAAALCAVAGGADIFLGYRYRDLLGFVDFVADVAESSSGAIVQIAWFTPFVGIGFLLLAGYHLFRSLQ